MGMRGVKMGEGTSWEMFRLWGAEMMKNGKKTTKHTFVYEVIIVLFTESKHEIVCAFC